MKTFTALGVFMVSMASGLYASPSVILAPIREQDAWTDYPVPPYEDADYRIIYRDFGHSGGQTPGVFIFSKHTSRWMQMLQLSTEGAKLGRAPDRKDHPLLNSAWDYSSLASEPYATLPLHTSNSISFPREILFDPKAETYAFRFNTDFKEDSVLTVFYIRKADLDDAFK